ncbi:MAG: response regulator transcription factor [Sphaerochaetaceae bacterium]|jgi:two-component system response regulator YesN
MSYTVVLVEDEELMRTELEQTTPWEELGLELVGSAENGIEGERLIKELEPDIVVTDIRLPGQDGLTMLSRCPVSHAVILSGHTDFSYMKQAIRLGVFDYLLKPVDDGELESTFRQLVAKIKEEDTELERLKKSKSDGPEYIRLPRKLGNHVVDSAIEFIAEHYGNPIGLQEAAAALDLSESHLSRLFKEVTGLNFLQYLNAWRINRAVDLLLNPKMNIGEISVTCGFPTPGYFAKIFKRFTGATPSQFRDEHPARQ